MKLRILPFPMMKFIGGPTELAQRGKSVELASISYASIWYIEGAGKNILVDAGGSAEIMLKRGHNVQHISSPIDALKTIGIDPKDIDIIIITHLHNDHNSLVRLYKNAKFIVQKMEWEGNFHPHPLEAPRIIPESFIHGLDFEIIKGDAQVTKGINILFTPGHTRGGQSVSVETEKGKAIICGLCTVYSNFEPPESSKKALPIIIPDIHLDAREAFDSLMRIKEEADIIIPLHDSQCALNGPIP